MVTVHDMEQREQGVLLLLLLFGGKGFGEGEAYMTLSKTMTLLSSVAPPGGRAGVLLWASGAMYSRWWGAHTGVVRCAQRWEDKTHPSFSWR